MDRQFYVYILANRLYGTLYVGVTNDLIRRVWEHRNDFVEGFTKRHQTHRLVWYEAHGCPEVGGLVSVSPDELVVLAAAREA